MDELAVRGSRSDVLGRGRRRAGEQLVTSLLWRTVQYVGFPETDGRLLHIPRAFSAEWLAAQELPIGQHRRPDQQVILMDGHDFDRSAQTDETIAAATSARPRTVVYENLARVNDGWIRDVCQTLGGLTRYHVACSAYQSKSGDAAIAPHNDAWLSLILQWEGAKNWLLGDGNGGQRLQTTPGDLFVLPMYVRHSVVTPPDPGHSTHLSFSLHMDMPI